MVCRVAAVLAFVVAVSLRNVTRLAQMKCLLNLWCTGVCCSFQSLIPVPKACSSDVQVIRVRSAKFVKRPVRHEDVARLGLVLVVT